MSSLPPGPRLPSALQGVLLWRLPQWWLERLHRRYGDTFSVHVEPVGDAVYLANPTDIRAVFAGDPDVFRAGEANTPIVQLLGERSVLLLDGAEHRARRRLMMPPFHRDAVRRQATIMAELAAAEVERWPVGREFALAPRMSALTFEIILRTVLGTDDEARLAALRATLPGIVDLDLRATLALMYPALLSTRPFRAVVRRRAAAREALRAEIAHTRADPRLGERPDVLAMLVRAAADPAGGGMDDGELCDQLVTLLLAGHETTATGLAWAFERLVRHPGALAKAVAAADTGDDGHLDAVVRETLRVRPVVFDVARRLAEPVELAGYRLPAGTVVLPTIGLVHRSERQYPDPLRFDPERMVGATPGPTEWLPFGGGARRCLGATFALVEMRIVLHEVLRRVELATTTSRGERARAKHVTLVPARGGRVRVRARRPAPAPSGTPSR